MHEDPIIQKAKRILSFNSIFRPPLVIGLILMSLIPLSSMADCDQKKDEDSGKTASKEKSVTPPPRSGAPPYPDDPEANGNPAKAWYN
jgi:hypothetical protein